MIPFIQIPLRAFREEETDEHRHRPVAVAIVLGLILCFQIALVLWIYYKQSQG
jgi:hypothetical protein